MSKKSLELRGRFICNMGHTVYGPDIEEGNQLGWLCPVCGEPLTEIEAKKPGKKKSSKVQKSRKTERRGEHHLS